MFNRFFEILALIGISCTILLFLHNKSLSSRLHRLESAEISSQGNRITEDYIKYINGPHGTYQYLKRVGERFETPFELNNTRKAEMNILFFNRVPKVGSQALMQLLKILGRQRKFDVERDTPKNHETVLLGTLQQKELAEEISELNEPASYSMHVAYVNFAKHDLPKPIYINLVRDPVERVISWYYYIRAPWYYIQKAIKFGDVPLPEVKWLKKDMETCVENHDKECTFEQNVMFDGNGDHRRQVLFFCGQSKTDCLPFNSAKAMQIAKQNVERDYAVVGSWEDTNVTLSVLEHYIPMFFKHAAKTYYLAENRLGNTNRNHFKPPVREEVKNLIRRNFTNEIEFYQFCKQRLYRQYEALKHNGHIK